MGLSLHLGYRGVEKPNFFFKYSKLHTTLESSERGYDLVTSGLSRSMGLRDHQFSPLPVRSAFVSLLASVILVWMLAVSASHKDAEVSSGLCHKAQPGPGRSGGFVSYSIYLFSCEEKQVSATVGITEMT